MRRFFARARALHERGVLGMNERNGALVLPLNPRRHVPRVDDKLLTKRLADSAGIPTPRSLAVIHYHHDERGGHPPARVEHALGRVLAAR